MGTSKGHLLHSLRGDAHPLALHQGAGVAATRAAVWKRPSYGFPSLSRRARRLRDGVHSVRFRVLATMLVMMSVGLTLAGFLVFGLQYQELDARVDQGLSDKARALEKLARSSSGGLLVDRLHDATDDIDPSRHEFMAALADGKVAWKLDGNPDDRVIGEDTLPKLASLTDPGRVVWADLGTEARPLRVLIDPVSDSREQGTVFLAIGKATGDQRAHIASSLHTYLLVAAGTIGVTAVMGALLAGRLLGPLRRLREASEIVSHDDLSRRVDVRGGSDEVAQLARTFNTMLERLDEGARGQQQFLHDAGHELRTPLTILRGHLELMSLGDPSDVASTRDLLLEEVDRMHRLVDDLLLLANTGHPDFFRKQPLRLGEFTGQLMDKIRVLGPRRWHLDDTEDAVVVADPQRLTQGLIQLAANAVRHTDPSAVIAVGARTERLGDNGRATAVVFWVRDDGPGVAPEDQTRIFERFGRAGVGRGEEGSGLGLAIVAAIAQGHGGEAGVSSTPGHGATFYIRLPQTGKPEA